jgi:glycosyltransferase involved in cell wall biosynthesis
MVGGKMVEIGVGLKSSARCVDRENLDEGLNERKQMRRQPQLRRKRVQPAEDVVNDAPSSTIVAVIPAYNEERFIGSVVLKALQYVDVVIVVDDGSADDTAEIARNAGAVVVQHQTNRGKGAALNSGFAEARALGARAVALLDGDGQHRPDDIPKLVRPVLEQGADMVVGSRYLDLKNRIPLYRRVGQCIITALTNISSGVNSTDSWSGYRAFSRRALERIYFHENGWGVDPEFQFKAGELDLNVVEVPIVAIYEEKAKRNPIPHGLKTLNAILRLIGQHRPLLFFSSTGFLILLTGFITGLWVVAVYDATRTLAIGTTLICLLLCIVGTLTLFTGFILHSTRGLILEFTKVANISGSRALPSDPVDDDRINRFRGRRE